MVLHFKKLESPLPKKCFVPRLFEIGSVVQRIFFNFVNVFLLFLDISWALHLKKLRSPSLSFAKFDWNWPSGSGEEDFLISSIYFHYFVIISPWQRAVPFIWTNLNPLHSRMFCASLVDSGRVVLETKMKMWKGLQTDGQTDRRTDRRRTTGDQKSWAKIYI